MHPVARERRLCLPLILQRTVGAMVGHSFGRSVAASSVLETGLTTQAEKALAQHHANWQVSGKLSIFYRFSCGMHGGVPETAHMQQDPPI